MYMTICLRLTMVWFVAATISWCEALSLSRVFNYIVSPVSQRSEKPYGRVG